MHEDAPGFGVLARPGVVVAVNLDTDESDGGSHPVAVGVEVLEGLVAVAVEIILHAADHVIEHLARDSEGLDRVFHRHEDRIGRGNVPIGSGELLPVVEQLRHLVVVGRAVDDWSAGAEKLDLGPVVDGFRLVGGTAGEDIDVIPVGDVIGAPAECVVRHDGTALQVRQILERVVEVAGLSSGELLAVVVRGLSHALGDIRFGPDCGIDVAEWVDQLTSAADNAHEERAFANRLERCDADYASRFLGQIDRRADPLNTSWLLVCIVQGYALLKA